MTTLHEAARALGEKGAPATEEERLLFEAWMQGHCWKVCGEWNGTTYVDDDETSSYVDPDAMRTRQLWAAWRDRAALAADAERVSVPREPTDAMICAGWDVEELQTPKRVWAAMLAAAEKEKG